MKEKTLEYCNCKTNIEKLRNQERKRNKFSCKTCKTTSTSLRNRRDCPSANYRILSVPF